MSKRKLSITIDEDLIASLDQIGEATGENRSQVLQRIALSGLESSRQSSALEEIRELFSLFAKPDGSRAFIDSLRDRINEKAPRRKIIAKAATGSPKAQRGSLTKNSQRLPSAAKSDPFGPPKKAVEVICIHCIKKFSSDEMIWDGEYWSCPTPGCNGSGYTFDICDFDSDFGRGVWEQAQTTTSKKDGKKKA